jgi:hypothetical protein
MESPTGPSKDRFQVIATESKSDSDSNKKLLNYLQQHPELNGIINEIHYAILMHKPENILDFLIEFFGNPKKAEHLASKLNIAR